MAKQNFTTGQILTANQMLDLQQTAMGGGAATAKTASYVLVAADAGSTVAMNAAGATTITVNTALFAAGDTVFIQNLGAGACTVTAGTATVSTAGSLILPQYDAGILYFTATGSAIFYDYIQAGAVSPLTTKGDVYTFSTSDARLGVGANNTVLTADSAEATGLKWAAAASGGGMTLLSTTTLSGSATTISGISGSYTDLMIIIYGYNPSTSGQLFIKPNGSSSLCDHAGSFVRNAASQLWGNFASNVYIAGPENFVTGNTSNGAVVYIYQYASSIGNKIFTAFSRQRGTVSSNDQVITSSGSINTASAISSLEFNPNAGTMSAGTVLVYGVK